MFGVRFERGVTLVSAESTLPEDSNSLGTTSVDPEFVYPGSILGREYSTIRVPSTADGKPAKLQKVETNSKKDTYALVGSGYKEGQEQDQDRSSNKRKATVGVTKAMAKRMKAAAQTGLGPAGAQSSSAVATGKNQDLYPMFFNN